MSAADNKRILEHVFAETAKGNGRPFVEALADDVRWTIIGTTAWSKTFVGKQAVLAELLGPLRAKFPQQNRVTAHCFIAEGDFVVVEARGNVTTEAGKPYNNTYCWVCRISGGKIAELTEYMDTQLVATALGER